MTEQWKFQSFDMTGSERQSIAECWTALSEISRISASTLAKLMALSWQPPLLSKLFVEYLQSSTSALMQATADLQAFSQNTETPSVSTGPLPATDARAAPLMPYLSTLLIQGPTKDFEVADLGKIWRWLADQSRWVHVEDSRMDLGVKSLTL